MGVEAGQSIQLEIDSKLANTTLIAMAVRGLCAMTTMSPVEINHLELCLVEVVNNATEHAYGNQPGHRVEVVVEVKEAELILTVSDWGTAMPPDLLATEDQSSLDPESSDTLLCSGRGLHIVKHLMDTVGYSSHQGKNSLTMSKVLRT